VPTSCIAWPAHGLRRVSIDSFGFGGANSHIILDDAFHTIEALGLGGNFRTLANGINGVNKRNGTNGVKPIVPVGSNTSKATPDYRLLTWSARDEAALTRMLDLYEGYIQSHEVNHGPRFFGDLAYTLAARRSAMAWRSFYVVDGQGNPNTLSLSSANRGRAARENGVAFIFTGQGAQYANMGMELLCYPIFEATLVKAQSIFYELGAEWALFGENKNMPRFPSPNSIF
jgi:acyl transferase domain-containing protein